MPKIQPAISATATVPSPMPRPPPKLKPPPPPPPMPRTSSTLLLSSWPSIRMAVLLAARAHAPLRRW